MTGTSSGQGGVGVPTRVLAYEPPCLLVLGSVRELTLGANGSVMDQSGRAAHGKPKP
jgi:hypothetical protein